jgi:hypothetical protein
MPDLRGSCGSIDADGERPVSNARAIWFRNGRRLTTAAPVRPDIRQSNIYGESNHSNFLQIFRQLDVARIRGIYPRLVFRRQIANSIATG